MSDKLPKGWKKVKLGEVVVTNPENIGKNFSYEEIFYLDTGSITRGKIEQLPKIPLAKSPIRAKRLVKEADIIYSSVRPVQRHYGYIKNPPKNLVVSTGFVIIRVQQKKANPKFIYYLLTSNEMVDYLDMIAEASTSAYPSLRLDDIENLEIKIPESIDEQRAIASVLSSLDDKIDLLHRQNKTLEQTAETIFRKWFIEDAKEDWEEKRLGDFFELLGGFAFKSKDYLTNGRYKVITIKNVQDGYLDAKSVSYINNIPEKLKSHQFLAIGDLLISLTGNVGRVCIVDESNCLLNQRVAKIFPKNKKWKPFAYFYFRQPDMIERLTYLSKGSAQLNLSPVETLKQKELFPDGGVIEQFNLIVEPIFDKILNNKIQIRTLEQLRDTLLPKLMSGEVRVRG